MKNKNQVLAGAGGGPRPRLATETGPKRIVVIDDINVLLRSVGVPMRLDVIPQYNVRRVAEWMEWMKMEGVEVENYTHNETTVETLRKMGIDLPKRSDNYSWQLGDLIVYVTVQTREPEVYLIDVL
jgi:hypothetical protein